MSNFILLFIVGLVIFVPLILVTNKLVDNSTDLNLDKERKLTEGQ